MTILCQAFQTQNGGCRTNKASSIIFSGVFVLTDEISVVSNICLLDVYKRLCETSGCPEGQPFAYLSILVVDD